MLSRVVSNPTTPLVGATLEDPLYYLHNFQWVLDWVQERYGDLLASPEWDFVRTFQQLPQPSRALLVRMVMRKGELFRADKLVYPEIGNIRAAAAPLIAIQWLCDQPSLSLEQVFKLFTWGELRPVLAPTLIELGLGPRCGKREAQSRLSEQEFWGECRAPEDWGLAPEPVFQLRVNACAERLRWLFFGNPYQGWSEFVLTELGLFQYEPVAFTRDSRPVHRSEELEVYWQLQACRQQLYDEQPLAEVAAAIPALPDTDNRWLMRTRDRLHFRLGREWERAGDLARAREAYQATDYPGARARLVRVLERQEAYREAYELAQAAQQAPETEAEAQQLERTLPRLRRKLSLAPVPANKPAATRRLDLELPREGAAPLVELAVREHLERPGAPVYYVENHLLNGLFGLLFWEAIFSPLSGAFFHPFQRGPADLYWPDFYSRRQALFEPGFRALNDHNHGHKIRATFVQKLGRQSPFVHWSALSEELIDQALLCIPPAHLKLCFERILRDVKANSAGLPDLIQFWPQKQRYRMIEVKGPGDRLQDNQKRWLAFFSEHQMPVSVCYLRWREAGFT